MTAIKKVVTLVYNRSGQLDKEQLLNACNLLEKVRSVVALPTDTLYGIAARVEDSEALERIYQIKGRDSHKPLAVCVPNVASIDKVAQTDKLYNRRVLDILFPGPITIVLKRSPSLNPKLNPGIETIGVRIPDHNFTIALAVSVGPLALTSANRSGAGNPIEISDFHDLWDELDCVYDCGRLRNTEEKDLDYKLASTVVDLSLGNKYEIIREGIGLNRVVNVLNRLGYKRKKSESK